MAIKSITQRWILNSLSVVLLGIIFVAIAFSFVMKNFYYTGAKQSITSRATTLSGHLIRLMEDSNTVNFVAEIRSIVENSEDKDKFEITAIDNMGNVVLSSSGFQYYNQVDMPDYNEAMISSTGMGYYVGESNNKSEKIMALTFMIPYVNGEYSAIRYVASMEKVDRLLWIYTFIFIGVAFAILCLVMTSGLYFVKSIVIPVREVGAAARKFATGDMSTRIVKKSDDELGELCDVINYMADEISAAEEMKNEFISSVSHELRTPLTAIKGWSETLIPQEGEDIDTQMLKKGMRVITSETERLSIMVEELLDFSRIQNGRLSLAKTNMDILAELGEAVLIYTERARRDNINLIYNEPENVSFIVADKNRIKQVFINIIDNALKYSDSGDTVTVEVEEKAGVINIVVKDTGCGISKIDLPKIKTKFYKANMTRRGSGIGLAVANEIIMMHDGEINIESELGVGTTVTIKLPVNQAGQKKIAPKKSDFSTTMEFNIFSERDK